MRAGADLWFVEVAEHDVGAGRRIDGHVNDRERPVDGRPDADRFDVERDDPTGGLERIGVELHHRSVGVGDQDGGAIRRDRDGPEVVRAAPRLAGDPGAAPGVPQRSGAVPTHGDDPAPVGREGPPRDGAGLDWAQLRYLPGRHLDYRHVFAE